MKKALIYNFVITLMALSINAFSYNYTIADAPYGDVVSINLFDDSSRILKLITYADNRKVVSPPNDTWYTNFSFIKFQNASNLNYINSEQFYNYYSNDKYFLNDLYIQARNQFLNYLYNEHPFYSTSSIDYSNAKILYDKDGFAVASLFENRWDGLYDNETIKNSGNLYNEDGKLVYYNGNDVGQLSFVDFSLISKNLGQGIGKILGLGVGLILCLFLIGWCMRYIEFKRTAYDRGIREDNKEINNIRREAKVLAYRTSYGFGELSAHHKDVLSHKSSELKDAKDRIFLHAFGNERDKIVRLTDKSREK